MVSSNSKYRLSPSVRITMDGTQGVLLDLARGKFYGLTFAAAEIAQALVNGASFGTLLELLQAKFDAPREELEQDLAKFLEKMERAELCDSG
jgi:coenzyme PQQ synthesis protein D (PqqD)